MEAVRTATGDATRALLVQALHAAPAPLVLWGSDGLPSMRNAAAAELLEGGSAGMVVLLAADGSAIDPAAHPAARTARGELGDGDHELLLDRDGSVRRLRSRVRALRGADGEPAGAIESLDELARASGHAGRGEAWEGVVDELPFMVWRCAADGRGTTGNRRFAAYTGHQLGGGAGRDWLDAAHGDDRPRIRTLWQQSLATGTAFSAEVRLRRMDGTYHWFLARAWPLPDQRGGAVHWLGSCIGIDEGKRLELELRRCNQELASFAHIASHDLQEPLRMVAQFLDLLRRRCGAGMDPAGHEYLGYALDGARRMQELIRKLLDYARIGRPRDPSMPVDAAAVANEAARNLATALAESGGTIDIGPLPAVRVDRVHLLQLLQNLLSNALKYRSQQREPRIVVSARRAGAEWEFSVADNGIGIARDDTERIFDLFQRLHGAGEVEGSGIGLAVCKKLVESYGGRIWLTSERGVGSTFHFTLGAS